MGSLKHLDLKDRLTKYSKLNFAVDFYLIKFNFSIEIVKFI